MRTHSWLLGALAAVAVTAAPAPTLAADLDNQTTLTFAAPIEVPGMTLQPGAYVFETAEGQGGRYTVRIHSSDRSKLITTTEAVSMKRDGPSDVVQYRPTILDSAPTALKGWFRAGSTSGYQLVYSAREAAAIANRTTERVIASVTEDGKGAQLVVIDGYGKSTPWQAPGRDS
ncbi:MAG TPA: hypothetical protein VFD69_18135 [Vicinamibacterales bacterium]|jgi:hypothetical protein|nr:hypothetical protein [Vicinamibacterales bacterium]